MLPLTHARDRVVELLDIGGRVERVLLEEDRHDQRVERVAIAHGKMHELLLHRVSHSIHCVLCWCLEGEMVQPVVVSPVHRFYMSLGHVKLVTVHKQFHSWLTRFSIRPRRFHPEQAPTFRTNPSKRRECLLHHIRHTHDALIDRNRRLLSTSQVSIAPLGVGIAHIRKIFQLLHPSVLQQGCSFCPRRHSDEHKGGKEACPRNTCHRCRNVPPR
mmetsp:Transcript_54471/g.127390  ORF Transcript_54471/g.127390 Transcript_54471/m.127390 type:complete len:215 (-) Transcript_54471:110-754(-)